MKIVVIGGSGLIGSKATARLRELGHDALAASPKSGVNAVTGEGLDVALRGAQVVVDVANSPSFEDAAAMTFFENAGRNLAAAERQAGVKHHVALSVVGTERLQASGYFRAKLVQENLIKASGIPFSIVRATQFFEFIGAVAEDAARDGMFLASPCLMQPIAADDVAAALVDVALSKPTNGISELAGPEAFQIDEIIRRYLASKSDPRKVVADDKAMYFGLHLSRQSLTPGSQPRLGRTHFADWLRRAVEAPHVMAG